jgi:hypothetical protein
MAFVNCGPSFYIPISNFFLKNIYDMYRKNIRQLIFILAKERKDIRVVGNFNFAFYKPYS